MKKTIAFLSTVFTVVYSCVCAEIIETNSICRIREYITPESLVIFDIDNTLMEPSQTLGNDQWFYHRLKQHKAAGMNAEDALEKSLAEWYAVQNVTKVRLVEPCAADLIQSLQKDNYTVMGLTTRGLGLCRTTIYQLKSLGINLGVTAPTHEEFHFMNCKGVLFRQGILFTAGSNKGKALAKLLHRIGKQPKNIVFINDKATHLREVEEVCEQYNVPFIGLRYGFLDATVAAFNPEIADIQFEAFGQILSDEEAAHLLNLRS